MSTRHAVVGNDPEADPCRHNLDRVTRVQSSSIFYSNSVTTIESPAGTLQPALLEKNEGDSTRDVSPTLQPRALSALLWSRECGTASGSSGLVRILRLFLNSSGKENGNCIRNRARRGPGDCLSRSGTMATGQLPARICRRRVRPTAVPSISCRKCRVFCRRTAQAQLLRRPCFLVTGPFTGAILASIFYEMFFRPSGQMVGPSVHKILKSLAAPSEDCSICPHRPQP